MRLYAVLHSGIRGDEFGTLLWLESSYGEILSTYGTQLTMHLYVLGMKLWIGCFGDSPFDLKLPSLLAV